MTVAEACRRLEDQLSAFRARDIVISTNIRPTLTGFPASGGSEPRDPGVALYFKRDGKPYCLACDRWLRVADNIAAIAAEIAANRGRERWGVVTLEEAFAGFAALPPQRRWWEVLGLHHAPETPEKLRVWFRELARVNHPDQGGTHDRMAELNAAYAEGLAELERRKAS